MAAIHFAPLQGYTDRTYREAHARIFGGVDAYYTPFVRLEKGGFRKKDLRDVARPDATGARVIPQLIASSPEEFRTILPVLLAEGYREVDINLGCPFPMQARAHRGAGILPYREEAEALLRTIEEFPSVSFSVKMRLGWESAEEAVALLPLLNALPLRQITLHPRLGIQQYKGKTDEEGFARFYESCERPLFYNGDLTDLNAIREVMGRYPRLAGVMLGRGLLAAPWLGLEYHSVELLSLSDKKERLAAFHEALLEGYQARLEGGDHQLLAKMKTVWDYLLPDADRKARKKILKSATLPAYRSAVSALLDR